MKRAWGRKGTWMAGGALALGLLLFLSLRAGTVVFWTGRAPALEPVEVEPATSTPEAAPPDRTRPLAVMIDNHPAARPPSGTAAADVVWEVPVEGGLTRDLLLFRSTEAEEVGPVRSARPYFLRWAAAYDAVYVHVGGSDEALAELKSKKLGLDDVDEFRYGGTFRRDSRRSAPHNTYTSTAALRELIEENGWDAETDAVDATVRGEAPAGGSPASSALVTVMGNGEEAEFRWDAEAGGYALWRAGRAAKDRDGTPIVPKTVIVLEADQVAIADPQGKGLIGLEAVGDGAATVLRDGRAFEGTWKKTSAAAPTEVVGKDGAAIPFAPGQLWYAVVVGNRGGGIKVTP